MGNRGVLYVPKVKVKVQVQEISVEIPIQCRAISALELGKPLARERDL